MSNDNKSIEAAYEQYKKERDTCVLSKDTVRAMAEVLQALATGTIDELPRQKLDQLWADLDRAAGVVP